MACLGDTPLHSAIRNLRTYLIPIENLLKQDNGDINVPNSEGETPLHMAVNLEVCSMGLIKLLLEHGADVKATTPHDGDTALHRIAVRCAEDVKWYPVASTLLVNGSDVNARNSRGCTPLHLVAEISMACNRSRIITLLLEHGSDVNARNLDGETPLHLYLRNPSLIGHFRTSEFLTKARDVNFVNARGETPLHVAVRSNRPNLGDIKCLLEHGVDASIKDARGENAYQAYCRAADEVNNSSSVDPLLLQMLIRKDEPQENSSLHVACLLHNVDSVQRLLRLGADVNAKDTFCYPPLYYAIIIAIEGVSEDVNKDYLTLSLMLDYGADVNRKIVMTDVWVRGDGNDWTMTRSRTLLEVALQDRTFLNDAEESRNYSDVCDIFVEHGARLLALQEKQAERGIDAEMLSQRNCRLVRAQLSRYSDKDLLSRCSEEVRAMSKTEIGDSLSFFDLLVASAKKTATYAKNKELIKAFDAKKARFPTYRRMLDAKLVRDLERRKLVESAAVSLSDALEFADPSDEFYERTLSYCSNADLMRLVEE